MNASIKEKNIKTILFVTGTRADFGKVQSLISACNKHEELTTVIFATGMHLLAKYGNTIEEIYDKFDTKIYPFINQGTSKVTDTVLANTITGLSHYLDEHPVDLIVVHGDRVEALAGAIVGALKNISVAHIEGGERSGTIDESIRHAITKFSHHHFVANGPAQTRVERLGENPGNIYQIGSPNIDIISNGDLPSLIEVKKRYNIDFDDYSIFIFHPVTTEQDFIEEHVNELLKACEQAKDNYVLICPNNDQGSEIIYKALERYKTNPKFRILPSLRFEAYITLLKNSKYIIGNSSSGIYDAPLFGVPTIDIGTRQNGRFTGESITVTTTKKSDILKSIKKAHRTGRYTTNFTYGDGKSSQRFIDIITSDDFFSQPLQKIFCD